MYRRLLRYVSPDGYKGDDARRGGGTYPNLMDAHSPFQIDGNFGGCAGVMEMLLGNTPPAAWPEGSLKGIRTRSGETADLTWKDGTIYIRKR
jgi:alpha-L-fucosidase 2